MELKVHYRVARVVFWFAQAIGVSAIILLLLFIGGNLSGKEINIILLHLALFFSGVILLFYSYYREWILKKTHRC